MTDRQRPAADSSLAAMVDHYLPAMVTAGDYALRIQPGLADTDRKDGPNEWVQALTDADLSIQNFFEVITLARFPNAGFYGEEQQSSLNARYFPSGAALRILLDPVNGTFLYRNQQRNWDIILSIVDGRRLLAAISYMPAHGTFYLATRDHGAPHGRREAPALAAMRPLALHPGSGACLTYQAPDVTACLSGAYQCTDIVADHVPGQSLDHLNALFTGELDVFACRNGDLLDWGAIAFIAGHAGATVTDLEGHPLGLSDDFDVRTSDMLVATDTAIHADVLRRLRRA